MNKVKFNRAISASMAAVLGLMSAFNPVVYADEHDYSQDINYRFEEQNNSEIGIDSDVEISVGDAANSSVATPSDATNNELNNGVNLMSTHTPISNISDLKAVIEDEKTENPVFTIAHKEELENNPDVRIEFYQYIPDDINGDDSDILNDDIAKLKDKTGAINNDSESGMEYFKLVKTVQGDTGVPFEYELSLVDDAYSYIMFRVVNTNDNTTYQAESRADGYLKEIKTDIFQIPIDRFDAKAEVVMYDDEPYMVLDSFTLDGEPLPEDKFTLDIYPSFDYLAHRDAFNKNGNDLNFDGYRTPYQAFIKDEAYTIPGDYVSSYNNGNAFKIKNDSTSIFDWTSNAVYGIRLDIDLHSAQRSNSGYQQAINTRTEKIHSTPALFDTRRILGEVVVDDKENTTRESVHDVSINLDNATDGEAGAGNRFFDGNVVEVEEYNFNDDDIEVRLSVSTDKDKDNFVDLDWQKASQVTFPDKYNDEIVYKVAVAARVKRQLVHEQMDGIVSLVDGKEYTEPIDVYYIVGAKGSDYLECGYNFDGGKVKRGDYQSIFALEDPLVQLENVDIDKDYPENSTDLAEHPHPGDTITATVEPADATVTWQWKYYTVKPANTISLAHEDLIDIPGANSNIYTVTESDVGKILVAVATGTGKYTGTAMFDFYSSDSGAEIGCVTQFVKLESIDIGTKTVSDSTGKEDIVLYPIVTTIPDVGLHGAYSWFVDGEPFEANYDNDGDGINESLRVTNEINNSVVTLRVNAYDETEGIPSSTGYYGHEYTGSYGFDFLEEPTIVGKINADVKIELENSLYGDSDFYVGDTLKTTTDIAGVYDEADNIKIEWIVCDDEKGTNPKAVKTSNDDNSSFTLTNEYKNKYIKIKVSYDGTGKEHFENLPFESELRPVRIHSLDSVSLKYKKTDGSDYADRIDKLLPGDSLKADNVKIENGKTANPDDYRYQWYSCDEDGSNAKEIAGATNQTLTVSEDLIGKCIKVVITGQNSTDGTVYAISSLVSSEQEPEPTEPEAKPESEISGGYSGNSDSDSGSSSSSTKNDVVNGTWTYDTATDKWTLNNHQYRNQWVYAFNGYTTTEQGQYDWFYFDANGNMVTGWFTDTDRRTYYLHETSDGIRGAMETGWVWIEGKCYYFYEISDGTRGHLIRSTVTPDGYAVDETGAWIKNGVQDIR